VLNALRRRPARPSAGNLEADIQAGAHTGFSLLWWFAVVSLGCGTAFQCLAGKLGLATGKVGLLSRHGAHNLRRPLAAVQQHAAAGSARLPAPPPGVQDLARHCGEQWPLPACWFLWAMMEVALVSVDIQETVGCAQALYILSAGHLPLWAGV
jgi:natural resistance-associated macrophage protein